MKTCLLIFLSSVETLHTVHSVSVITATEYIYDPFCSYVQLLFFVLTISLVQTVFVLFMSVSCGSLSHCFTTETAAVDEQHQEKIKAVVCFIEH